MSSYKLKDLLNPESVAVIGASEDQSKFGGRVFRSLIHHGYAGKIYPINPMRKTLFGLEAYPSVSATPMAPDMVIMAIPQPKVKDEIAACAERGVRTAIIITSKFSDAGIEGLATELELVALASAKGMRLIGPNCLGLISPAFKLALCSTPALDVEHLINAPIGFISQSGALMGTLFDRAHGMGIGFSHCISIGNQADLELADFIDFLIEDSNTAVICSYVEGIKSPARFVQLARRARAAGKPWLMVKAGTTAEGSDAAYSHTASLAGDFAALKAVCTHENVVLMDDPLAMLILASAMVRYPGRPMRSVGIITTSGGGGAIAADRLTEAGIPLARFSDATVQALAQHYPTGQAGNPIDLGGRSDEGAPAIGVDTAAILLADSNTDLGLVVMTTAPDVPGITRQLADGAQASGKPLFHVMLPGRVATSARAMLIERRMPYSDTLAEAVAVLKAWQKWSAYRVPSAAVRPPGCVLAMQTAGALSEFSAKAMIEAAGIPVNRGIVAESMAQALHRSSKLPYPMVLKVMSVDIVHKSDVGGVALNIRDASDLRKRLDLMSAALASNAPSARIDGYYLQTMEQGELEMIIGARRDPQFGAQVMLGAGGVLVELVREVVIIPAPLSQQSALDALKQLSIAPLLGAFRGRAALDIDAIADAVVRLGWIASDLANDDFEIEVNPLLVRSAGNGVMAVDARARIGATDGKATIIDTAAPEIFPH